VGVLLLIILPDKWIRRLDACIYLPERNVPHFKLGLTAFLPIPKKELSLFEMQFWRNYGAGKLQTLEA